MRGSAPGRAKKRDHSNYWDQKAGSADFTQRIASLAQALDFQQRPFRVRFWSTVHGPELQHGDQHGHCAESQAFDH